MYYRVLEVFSISASVFLGVSLNRLRGVIVTEGTPAIFTFSHLSIIADKKPVKETEENIRDLERRQEWVSLKVLLYCCRHRGVTRSAFIILFASGETVAATGGKVP